jgi:hypothetical protein
MPNFSHEEALAIVAKLHNNADINAGQQNTVDISIQKALEENSHVTISYPGGGSATAYPEGGNINWSFEDGLQLIARGSIPQGQCKTT